MPYCTMALVLELIMCVCVLQGVLAADWSYSGDHGPSHWMDLTPACGQGEQSPINIYEGDVKSNSLRESIAFTNYDTSNGLTMTLKNNGHSAVVALGGTTNITISGGGLPEGVFRAIQFHFHWGRDTSTGSEHLINSEPYPMEIHIVHYNTKYANVTTALTQKDGLAVLGFMFKVSNFDNQNYRTIVSNLGQIREPGENQTGIQAVPLNTLLPETVSSFYRYSGSLTTPSCQESVTWTVFKEPITISNAQLQIFRTLLDPHGHAMVDNYRPEQELNGRTVLANFNPDIHWSYSEGHVDAEHWRHYYSRCGSKYQSPIDISLNSSELDVRIGSLLFHNYSRTTDVPMTLKNNGHTIQIDVNVDDISISAGGLTEAYQAAQFHFHWGSDNMRGSEHLVNSKAYPMEVHFVHFKKSLLKLADAASVPQGLAVLGFFFEISPADNPVLNHIIDRLPAVLNPGTNTTVPSFSLSSLLPKDKDDFYRYSGSLTTPRCYETVIWTVFKNTIKISSAQLEAFRQIKSSEKDALLNNLPMVNNFRLVQDLNRRIIQRNFVVFNHESGKWSYPQLQNKNDWADSFPKCASKPSSSQSPINIMTSAVKFQEIGDLVVSDYQSADGVTMAMENNGHTVVISINSGRIEVSGGGLAGTYRVTKLDFHWGAVNMNGSEHLINNKGAPMELNIVHFNTKFADYSKAVSQTDGIAIFAFLYQISTHDNSDYEEIVDKLASIKEPDSKTYIKPTPLAYILPARVGEYYLYQGSLTQPPCHENVTWLVFKNVIQISQKQLDSFRTLKSSDVDISNRKRMPLVNNYRSVQPLNNRQVVSNFVSHAIASKSTVVIINSILLKLIVLLKLSV